MLLRMTASLLAARGHHKIESGGPPGNGRLV